MRCSLNRRNSPARMPRGNLPSSINWLTKATPRSSERIIDAGHDLARACLDLAPLTRIDLNDQYVLGRGRAQKRSDDGIAAMADCAGDGDKGVDMGGELLHCNIYHGAAARTKYRQNG